MENNRPLTSSRDLNISRTPEYLPPTEAMTFKGTLDSRSLGKKNSLVCNFTAEDGRKIKLTTYLRKEAIGDTYSPKNCAYNFADEFVDGLSFVCTVKVTGKGRPVWISAK